ncbi:hypothetical protein ACFQJ7_00865 [Halovenus rubra]|uniref:Uncharacterized protein n=2 Tax=Halovenus rubra TaxID=869890 RepID=A0ABD5X060_9EURY|nr:hypothetical protein [Halovenus rubra]
MQSCSDKTPERGQCNQTGGPDETPGDSPEDNIDDESPENDDSTGDDEGVTDDTGEGSNADKAGDDRENCPLGREDAVKEQTKTQR